MSTRIIFNGKEYASPDAMPGAVRQAYEKALAQLADADRNGIPDILERGGAAGDVIGIQHTSITVNGRTFGSVDEMPAVVRRLYEQAVAKVDADRNGIPDGLEAGAFGAFGARARTEPLDSVRQEMTWSTDVQPPSGETRFEPLGTRWLRLALALAGLAALLTWWQQAQR